VAQRLKLVTELAKAPRPDLRRPKEPHSLYILGDPSVGLTVTFSTASRSRKPRSRFTRSS